MLWSLLADVRIALFRAILQMKKAGGSLLYSLPRDTDPCRVPGRRRSVGLGSPAAWAGPPG